MITALGGGVGAAKFLKGLSEIIAPPELNIVINTGDDIDLFGFRISPDIDTIIYKLSGMIDEQKGWGLKNDTYNCLEALGELGYETWFKLGDKDFATQTFKNKLTRRGLTLAEITAETARLYGIGDFTLLPMTDDPVETWIETDIGSLHFQEYYIKHSMEPEVLGINIKGINQASAAPGVIESIENSDLVILCPSNPIISIGPILKVKGLRDALSGSNSQRIAISPLIGGKPLKGPADRLMKGLGLEVSSFEIANLYKDFLDLMVLDESDREEAAKINELGIKTFVTDTVISNDRKSKELSETILNHINFKT